MILVTVGMQLGFDRLISAMDGIAPDLGVPVIAQTGRGSYRPLNMEAYEAIAPKQFEALVGQSQLIVSHAGIGTLLAAQRSGTPIILFPRRADLGEHRNDHQLASAKQLRGRDGIWVAEKDSELKSAIDEGLGITIQGSAQSQASNEILTAVSRFIEIGRL